MAASALFEGAGRWRIFSRVALAILMLYLYSRFVAVNNYYSPLDYVNLAFHEAGHVFFSPFGRFLMLLGGTVLQLLIPLACAFHFKKTKTDPVAYYLAVFWAGENLLNISIYIADARTRALPLVGSGEHDWTYLLSETGLLVHDQTVARVVFGLGSLIVLYSILRVILAAFLSSRH